MSELHPKMGEYFLAVVDWAKSFLAGVDSGEMVFPSPLEAHTLPDMERAALEAQREIEAAAIELAAEFALEKRDAIKIRNHGHAQRRMALETFADNLRTLADRVRKGEA